MIPRLKHLGLAVAATAFLASSALADTPKSDQEFLDAHLPGVTGYADKAVAVTSPEEGLEMIRRLLGFRLQTLVDLNAKHPLTTMDGIETQDAFDGAVVTALHRLSGAAIASDTSHVTLNEAQRYMNALGPLPDLGKSPLPFMVISLAELTAMNADTLAAAGKIPRRAAAKIALGILQTAGDRYVAAREAEGTIADTQKLRQNSIVMRLRCPKDEGTYRLEAKRNRIKENGEVVTIYFLKCQVCSEPLTMEFPYELATKLNQMSKRQKQATPPQPARPSSVDP